MPEYQRLLASFLGTFSCEKILPANYCCLSALNLLNLPSRFQIYESSPTTNLIEESKLILTPDLSEKHGIVAIGGEFEPELLLRVYRQGIFPWPENDAVKLWFCPERRCVIRPKEVKVSKSLRALLNKNRFTISIDSDFQGVIDECSRKKINRESTWITPELRKAFIGLHHRGYAHSFEVWNENVLVGGLYGLAIGNQFSGESMFHQERDASKVAFVFLNRVLDRLGFDFIDCQVATDHLLSLGAREIERNDFLKEHSFSVKQAGVEGNWNNLNLELGLGQTSDLL